MTAYITYSNVFRLVFFNSKEVFNIKYFDTERQAKNYCKKYNVTLVENPNLSDIDVESILHLAI